MKEYSLAGKAREASGRPFCFYNLVCVVPYYQVGIICTPHGKSCPGSVLDLKSVVYIPIRVSSDPIIIRIQIYVLGIAMADQDSATGDVAETKEFLSGEETESDEEEELRVGQRRSRRTQNADQQKETYRDDSSTGSSDEDNSTDDDANEPSGEDDNVGSSADETDSVGDSRSSAGSGDEGDSDAQSDDGKSNEDAKDGVEEKSVDPQFVPTTGNFYLHDDRFSGRGRGRGRGRGHGRGGRVGKKVRTRTEASYRNSVYPNGPSETRLTDFAHITTS